MSTTPPSHRLRVLLVNYRCADLIAQQLDSGVFAQDDVVIVDNASDPEQMAALACRVGARCVALPRNAGFAGGMNAGAALAPDDGPPILGVLLLNPDVQLSRDARDALVTVLTAGRFDAVGPVLLDSGQRPWVSSAGGPVTVRAVAWYFTGLSHLTPRLSGVFWTRRQIRHGPMSRPAWLCGACLLLAPTAMSTFGELPTDELVNAEDMGWGTAATAAGARLMLVRDVSVLHVGGASGGTADWIGPTRRLFVRRMGRTRGTVAAAIMTAGLAARRYVRAVKRRPYLLQGGSKPYRRCRTSQDRDHLAGPTEEGKPERTP